MAGSLKLISEAVEKGDDKKVVQLVTQASERGGSARDILEKALIPGIQELSKSFKDGTAYLPHVLLACRAMTRGVEILQPQLSKLDVPKRGTVVIGTVEDDVHDIGKNIVKLMLECNGFQLEDLGTDVTPDAFVAGVQNRGAHIVAVSALLTTTMLAIPNVIAALSRAGLRDDVRVMIGGAPVTRQFADEIGADGFGDDHVSAVDEAARLMAL